MQRSNPFARALAVAAMIRAAFGDPAKMAAIPEYQSRGKGRGLHSGRKRNPSPSYRDMVKVETNTRGKVWLQKENGAREVARRQRQIERSGVVGREYIRGAQAYAI